MIMITIEIAIRMTMTITTTSTSMIINFTEDESSGIKIHSFLKYGRLKKNDQGILSRALRRKKRSILPMNQTMLSRDF